jgi:IS30 family transposase
MSREIGYGFTNAQRQELWDRYQRGESLNAIARALGKTSSSIYNHLRPSGGIRPVPRKTLGFRTPAQKFNERVAATV